MAQILVDARQGVSRALDPVTSAVQRLTDRREVRASLLLLLLVAVFIYPLVDQNVARVDVALEAEVFILLALGLNIVVGFAGLLDLGYAAFFAIGAYTIALLGSTHFTPHHTFSNPLLSYGPGGVHVNFFLLLPIAALAAAGSGVLFGAPTLRLRGDYLAIVTLGFGEIVPKVIENLGQGNVFGWPNITDGVNRLTGIDTPPNMNLGGVHWTFLTNDPKPWYYLGLAIVVISVIAISSLKRSRLGRAWEAIREDEVAASHMGINITRTRLLAFALGASVSGFGGALEASRLGSVDYTQFGFTVSITILVMVIFGGMGSIPGVILGATIITYLNETWLETINAKLHDFGGTLQHAGGLIGALGTWLYNLDLVSAKPLVFGLILLFTMLLRPQGLWPSRTRAAELHPETEEVLEEEDTQLYTVRTE